MMKSIFLIFCYNILTIFSLKQINPKICINCKHFIPDNDNGIFGKCSFFQKKEGKIHFLITGIEDKKNYYYCSTSRESKDMCGEEGKYYIQKEEIVKNNA